MAIKGFVFDLDGVITDSAEYHFLAWQALAEDLGIVIDREFNEQLKGVSRMDSLERILKYGEKDQLFTKQEKEMLTDKKNEHYVSLIKDVTEKDLLPGIADFLLELKNQHMKLALASASKNGPFLLEKLGVKSMFDTIVDPTQLAKGKPDPEIFKKGAEQLGLSVEECVGVEDAPAGITAIKAAGMFSVGIGSKESLSDADYLISSTKELSLEKILAMIDAVK